MKTAVSLPDAVFRRAERLAKRLRVTRSELYRRALQEYVARHAPEAVTDALDRLSDEIGAESPAFVKRAARRALERSEW